MNIRRNDRWFFNSYGNTNIWKKIHRNYKTRGHKSYGAAICSFFGELIGLAEKYDKWSRQNVVTISDIKVNTFISTFCGVKANEFPLLALALLLQTDIKKLDEQISSRTTIQRSVWFMAFSFESYLDQQRWFDSWCYRFCFFTNYDQWFEWNLEKSNHMCQARITKFFWHLNPHFEAYFITNYHLDVRNWRFELDLWRQIATLLRSIIYNQIQSINIWMFVRTKNDIAQYIVDNLICKIVVSIFQ